MTNPVKTWLDRVLGGVAPSIQATGARIKADIRPRIDARKGASGKAQKANQPATAAAKRRQIGHDIPLKDQGILCDPDRYTTTTADGGLTFILTPPPERIDAIIYNRQRGYEVFEVPGEAAGWLDEELKKRLPQ